MPADSSTRNARILIVDDEESNVRLLERILHRAAGSADLRATTDPRTVPALYGEFEPDLVLLDLHMPHLDGFGVMDALKRLIPPDSYVPILVLTADITPEAKQQALAGGAKDFLTKPFDPTEVVLRIGNLLETRALHLEMEEKVRARTQDLEEAHLDVVERLALAAEYREDGTGEHTRRVGQTSALLARARGLPQAEVMQIRQAAPLHDVGKIAVPDRILLKRDRLTPEEWDVMKAHTTMGAKLLSRARYPLLQMAEAIALSHHERWDGSGYPQGLEGESIPLPARIVAVADAFDAMTHARPYQPARAAEDALAEIERCAGAQFDPRCVEAFLSLTGDPVARPLLGLRHNGR
jgi:putative two-component system response regulator